MPNHLRCMIAEDQVLIGMAMEASLEEAGFRVVGPFLSNDEALRSLEDETPDVAVLDVVMKDGSSVAIARELKRRGVRFAIYSGLQAAPDAPEFRDAPWLEKPVSRETLIATMRELAAPASGGEP